MKEARNIVLMPGSEPPATNPVVGRAEKPALGTLFESEESPLLRYAFSLTGRRAVAEELVQEVFLQLHAHWDTVENPKAWLYRAVRNRAYNHARDHKREILTGEDPDKNTPASTGSPEDLLQRMEAAGFLRLLVAELDEGDRRLIELKYYREMKYCEIADETGMSVGNVGYRLHHILKDLCEKLRKLGIDGTN